MINEVKSLFNDFLICEADARYKRLKPDMGAYNKAYEKMHSYTIAAMTGMLGIIRMKKLDSNDFYANYTNISPFNPRHLYKISHYNHNKYKDVYIAYVSQENPYMDYKGMSYAFFLIKEEEKYVIAKQYIYSNHSTDGFEYIWGPQHGYNDLTFDSLGEFISTVRYLEPIDDEDSMKMYHEEK